MAAVAVDAARAARMEAQRLRVDAQELRLEVRRTVRLARARTEKATAERRGRRVTRIASPWSGLMWLREDEELNRVLVPLG